MQSPVRELLKTSSRAYRRTPRARWSNCFAPASSLAWRGALPCLTLPNQRRPNAGGPTRPLCDEDLQPCLAWQHRARHRKRRPARLGREQEGRRPRYEDNPLLLADRRAKRLASLLAQQPSVRKAKARIPFIQPLVGRAARREVRLLVHGGGGGTSGRGSTMVSRLRDQASDFVRRPHVVLGHAAASRSFLIREQRQRTRGDDPAAERELEDCVQRSHVPTKRRRRQTVPLEVSDDRARRSGPQSAGFRPPTSGRMILSSAYSKAAKLEASLRRFVSRTCSARSRVVTRLSGIGSPGLLRSPAFIFSSIVL